MGACKAIFVGIVTFISLLSLAFVLVAAYADFEPVEVTVEDASLGLGRLALAKPAGHGKPASLSYNLSLTVAVSNPNWAIRVWRTAALDAELLLGGTPFAVVRLAGAEERELIGPTMSKVYRAAAVAEPEPVALGIYGAAELAGWKRVTGLVNLELGVSDEVHYQAHSRRRSFTVRCALRLPLATSPMAVAVARFEHTLPQECAYV